MHYNGNVTSREFFYSSRADIKSEKFAYFEHRRRQRTTMREMCLLRNSFIVSDNEISAIFQ